MAATHLLALLETTELFTLLQASFVLYIAIQLVVISLCLGLMFYQGALKDLLRFLYDYWQLRHLRYNLLSLSLWISTLLAYLSLQLFASEMKALTLAQALDKSLLISLYVYLGLAVFLVYVLYQSARLLMITLTVSRDLKRLRRYRSLRVFLQKVREFPLLGTWSGVIASLTHSLSERLLRHFIELRMRRDLYAFLLTLTGEYLLLMSIAGGALLLALWQGFS